MLHQANRATLDPYGTGVPKEKGAPRQSASACHLAELMIGSHSASYRAHPQVGPHSKMRAINLAPQR